MKNHVKLVLALCSTAVFMSSCQKNKQTPAAGNDEATNILAPESSDGKTPGKGINACYDPYSKKCYHIVKCNCTILKEIVISVGARLINLSGGNNSVEVGNAFNSADLLDVVEQMEDEHVTALQSGTYYINIINEDATDMCFLAGPTYPVTESNAAFQFQYDK